MLCFHWTTTTYTGMQIEREDGEKGGRGKEREGYMRTGVLGSMFLGRREVGNRKVSLPPVNHLAWERMIGKGEKGEAKEWENEKDGGQEGKTEGKKGRKE